MSKAFKKIISLILIISSTLVLFSCEGDREYDEATVIASAKPLIEKSATFNDLFWGYGVMYDEYGLKEGQYYEASYVHLYLLGYETVEDIINAASEVYSKGYIGQIKNTVFYDFSGNTSTDLTPRYYQKYSDAEKKEPECIMVDSTYEVLLRDEVEYLYDTLSVKGSKGKIVFVNIDVIVRRDEAEQRRTLEIGLVEEKSGWRLETPTYIVYNEFLDEDPLAGK